MVNRNPKHLIERGSPFELMEAELNGTACKVFKHAPDTLVDLYKRARMCKSRECLVAGGTRMTYEDVFRRAELVSCTLTVSVGKLAGARIALLLDNVWEWVVGFIAITMAGGTAVALGMSSSAARDRESIEAADCHGVICSQETAGELGEMPGMDLISLAEDAWWKGPAHRACFLSRSREVRADARWGNENRSETGPEDLAVIAFTSGSTGKPKGVELTHRGMVCGMMNMLLGAALGSLADEGRRANARRSAPVSLLTSPLSHISGYGNLLLTLYLGGKLVLAQHSDAERIGRLIETEAVTSLVGATPQVIQHLLSSPRLHGVSTSLRGIVVQGAACNPAHIEELCAAMPEVSVASGYGMTETNGSVCVVSEAILERPATVGRVLPSVDLRIMRDEARRAGVGEAGEVWVRGAMLMRGYWRQPHATAAALSRGWLRTGDLGRLDEDGFLYILERLSDRVVCNGVDISCSEMERAVLETRATDEVAVFGVSDGAAGEVVVVAVAACDSRSRVAERVAALLTAAGWSGRRAAHFMWLESLPRTLSGKVDRAALRGRFQKDQRERGAGESGGLQ